MEITEMEKIDYILREGAKNTIGFLNFIKEEINEFEHSPKRKDMLIGQRYYENEGDIKDKKRYYIADGGAVRIIENKFFSNYKLAHSIPRKLVNQKAGFLLKKKMNVKEILKKDEKEDEDFKKVLKTIFNDRTHKLLKYTLIEAVNKGISWWQVYIDEEGNLKLRRIKAEKIVALWKDDEHEKLDAIIIVYKVIAYIGKEKKIIKKAEYWDLEGVRYLVYEDGKLINDVERIEEVKDTIINENAKDEDEIILCSHFIKNGKPTNWTRIPFIYWKYNGDEKPLIFYLKSLVDCYDELTSIYADTIKDTPNGVNVVKNYGEDIKEFNKNLQELNTIFLDEDGDYKRENVSIDINAFKEFIELLRRDIYETGAGVDTQSEKFQTAQSGVALQELFNDLDLDCSNIETEFQSSLEYLMFFVYEYMKIIENKDYTNKEVEFIFNKSMITNETEKISNCNVSTGTISKKTVLANHPWVRDVDEELEQIENEEKENQQEYDKILKQMQNNNKTVNNGEEKTNNNDGQEDDKTAKVGDA